MAKLQTLGTYALFLVGSLAVSYVSTQEVDVVTRDALAFTIPNPFGTIPLLETNDQSGRFVGIHIPFLLDLKVHHRQSLLASLFSMRIFSGFIDFNYDKILREDGNLYGPLKDSISLTMSRSLLHPQSDMFDKLDGDQIDRPSPDLLMSQTFF